MRFSAGSTAVFIRWSSTSVMNGCDIRIPEGVRIRIRLFGHYELTIYACEPRLHRFAVGCSRLEFCTFLGRQSPASPLEARPPGLSPRFSRACFQAFVSDVVSGSGGEARSCNRERHTVWTCERVMVFAVDPAQGVQDGCLGAYRQAGTAGHPVLAQRYGPSGDRCIDAGNILAHRKIHQEQIPAVKDILTVDACARHR